MSGWRRVVATVTAFLPTRRMTIAVALLAPLWLLSWWSAGFVIAAAATVALLVAVTVDTVLLPDSHDLDVEREAPLTLGVGDSGEGRYAVRSHWGRPLHLRLFDALPVAHVVVRQAECELDLSPRSSGELAFTLFHPFGSDRRECVGRCDHGPSTFGLSLDARIATIAQ